MKPPADDGQSGLWASGLMGRFALLGLGVWLHAADSLVTATISPAIVDDLGGVAYLNWTIALYQVGAIIAGAAAAVSAARFGIKRVFIGATTLYSAGCLLAALAPTMAALLGGRLVQGLGGGMLLSLSYVAVEAWFPPRLWARLFAFTATIWGGGSLLGPLIGGAFSGPHTWRNAFWLFAAQALALALLAAFWMPKTLAAQIAAKLAGSASAAPGPAAAAPPAAAPPAAAQWPLLPLLILSAATLIIAESGAASGGGPTGPTGSQLHDIAIPLLGCLLGSALLYWAARLDRRAAVRLLPRELLDVRHQVGAGLMMVFALALGTTGFWAYGPLILKLLFNTRPLITGYILAGEAIAWSVATMAAASARPKHDRGIIRGGAVAIALGAAGFAVTVPTGSFVGIVGCALLQGAGFGVCWPAIVQRVVRFADPSERSLASSAVSTIQRIGYAIGTAAVGIAANSSGLAEGASAAAAERAGIWVFAAFIPVLGAGLICAWRFTLEPPPAP